MFVPAVWKLCILDKPVHYKIPCFCIRLRELQKESESSLFRFSPVNYFKNILADITSVSVFILCSLHTQKELSTVEDPFDAPTYHIPEKPVTFTEGASYSLVILAGLGIAGAAAYGVFKELIFQPKEYKIFDKALARVQDDSQVRVRIGSPIKGYGQETKNRAARQRIPNRIWTDEDGVEHVQILFHIRGPQGGGQVRCEMFKDKEDNQWKYTYLTVDILSPTPAHLILESFFSS